MTDQSTQTGGVEAGLAAASLIERERELSEIGAVLAEAGRGAGQALLIEGPAGVGKSALLRAGAAEAAANGFEVLSATGRQIERGFAFGVVVQLLAPIVEALSKVERRELFSGAADLARPLFEQDGETAPPGEIFPRLHGLHWLCANLSARRPLQLTVDDAHWCDEPSLAFLAYLTARVGELPLCVTVAVRSGETEQGKTLGATFHREGASSIEPAPLSEGGVASLLSERLGRDDELLAGECARATGGNPLFLRELIRAIEEHSVLEAEAVAELAPPRVGRIVLDRIAGMPAEDAQVVRAAAVLGDGADPRLVSRLSGVDPGQAGDSIDRLIEAGLIDGDGSLGFTHPIVRQAIYGSITPAARSRSHLEAARALAEDPALCERAAAHLLEVELPIDSPGVEAIEALRLAARRARERGATEHGALLLARALQEDLEPGLRREVLLELGVEELRLGAAESVEHLREAANLSATGTARAEATGALAAALAQTGALNEAAETCDRALEDPDLGREQRLALEAQRANASWLGGTMTAAGRRRLRALEDQVANGRTPAERAVLTILAVEGAATASRRAGEVSDLAHRALGGGALLTDLGAEHPSFTSAVAALTLSGNLAAAVAEWSNGIERSRRRGSLAGYANALFSRAYARYLIGDLAGAEADAVEGLELLPESGLVSQPFPLVARALVAVERGEPAPEVEQGLELQVAREGSAQMATVNYASLASAQLALSRSDFELALNRFLETGRRAKLTGWTGPAAMGWRSGAAQALRALKRTEEALETVDEELELARSYEAPGPLGIALRTKATLIVGEEGIELARRAAATLEGSEARLEHAKALVELGAQLRRSGASADCREPLREGLDLAHRCGSLISVERAMEELRASGARPRRPALRGVEALSPQERQTTQLAAEGLSNREIAEAMFLTRRTVEMHLSGAYRKLEIRSREELSDALGREPPARGAPG